MPAFHSHLFFELTVDTLVYAIESLLNQLHLTQCSFCSVNGLRILLVTRLLHRHIIDHPLFDRLHIVVFLRTLIHFLVYLSNFLDEFQLLLDHFSLVVFRRPYVIEEDVGINLEDQYFILKW